MTDEKAPDNKRDVDRPDRNKPGRPPMAKSASGRVKEIGGPKGPEPTRYGDWEKNGRVSDF